MFHKLQRLKLLRHDNLGKLVKLSKLTLPLEPEFSIIRIFSSNVSTWLLTWLKPNFEVLSLEGLNSKLPPYGPVGGTIWSVFRLGDTVSLLGRGRVACTSRLEPDGPNVLFLVPPISCHIMWIISTIFSFRRAISMIVSTSKGSLVDISKAQDLVIMGSWCDGNLDCFLWAIFLFIILESKSMGLERDRSTFKNLTKWKQKKKKKTHTHTH